MNPQQSASPDASPGLLAGVAGIAKNAFGLLVSRIELAALELGEIRSNLLKLLLAFALGIVALWLALTCWTALIVVLAWDMLGWKILLLIAAIFTLFALIIFFRVRAMLASDRLSMPATMAELRKDRDALL
jgi:uncharacterized membrane protein YqjE